MQALVYIFIVVAALGVAAAAYFGFMFTPVEAFVAALVFGAVAVILVERSLRQRAEARLEKAVEDLSRLLSTDAQAGSVLSQRINALIDVNPAKRLEGLEADVSVLGTVVRQVAEAVAELESRAAVQRETPSQRPAVAEVQRTAAAAAAPPLAVVEQRARVAASPPEPAEPEPVVPLELVREALDQNRLTFHIQPVITLPQRRTYGYDLVARLMLEDGDLADAADFLPRKGGEDVLRRVDMMALNEAITMARRARTSGQPVALFLPLTRATLADLSAMEQFTAILDANGAIAPGIFFRLSQATWVALAPRERAAAASIARLGAGFTIVGATNLRADFTALSGEGVRSIRVDAASFIRQPESFADFHSSDIAPYLKRFEIDLIGTGIRSEQEIITLLEDGIAFAQGPHIARPGPARPDLMLERAVAERLPRRVES